MAEYIERGLALEAMDNLLHDANFDSEAEDRGWINAIYCAYAAVGKIPSADVRPERHGQWIPEADYGICSECGADHSIFDTEYVAYCPGCGAKMDGKDGKSD